MQQAMHLQAGTLFGRLECLTEKVRLESGWAILSARSEAASEVVYLCRILSRTPLGRIADPDEIGQIAVFLASPASSYITGVLGLCAQNS